jgi:tellurite resistance protein
MPSKRIERLRDKLLSRGQPTLHPPAPAATPTSASAHSWTPELAALTERVRPFAEVMYLVLTADTSISPREHNVLRGALRSLTEGALSSEALGEMMRAFERHVQRDGVELRLDQLASILCTDRADARLALGLATAAADTDCGVGNEERAIIEALAERLNIRDEELQALLHETEEG